MSTFSTDFVNTFKEAILLEIKIDLEQRERELIRDRSHYRLERKKIIDWRKKTQCPEILTEAQRNVILNINDVLCDDKTNGPLLTEPRIDCCYKLFK